MLCSNRCGTIWVYLTCQSSSFRLDRTPKDPRYPYWTTIQNWEQAIANGAPYGIEMVSAKDLKAIPGNPYHLDHATQITLGGRMADAMYQILP
jgi:hypothetical protein